MKKNLPTIFSFNLWGPLANSINYKSLFKKNGLLKLLKNKNNHLLPILNYGQTSIEERSSIFSQKLENLLKEKNIQKYNLVSFAINGIDARLTLYENEILNKNLNKLITIGSPHKGALISDLISKNVLKSENKEKLNYILGVHTDSLKELNRREMKDFNEFLEDGAREDFFSLNGDKVFNEQPEFLKEVFSQLLGFRESEEMFFGDGVFFDEETKFFNHDYQVNADCYDLSPFRIDEDVCGFINRVKDV